MYTVLVLRVNRLITYMCNPLIAITAQGKVTQRLDVCRCSYQNIYEPDKSGISHHVSCALLRVNHPITYIGIHLVAESLCLVA